MDPRTPDKPAIIKQGSTGDGRNPDESRREPAGRKKRRLRKEGNRHRTPSNRASRLPFFRLLSFLSALSSRCQHGVLRVRDPVPAIRRHPRPKHFRGRLGRKKRRSRKEGNRHRTPSNRASRFRFFRLLSFLSALSCRCQHGVLRVRDPAPAVRRHPRLKHFRGRLGRKKRRLRKEGNRHCTPDNPVVAFQFFRLLSFLSALSCRCRYGEIRTRCLRLIHVSG